MAARYWINGGINNDWGDTSNWSATSGGAGGASVPTNADDVTFDASGNANCITNTTSRSCKTLTITAGYTSTLTLSFNLIVSGNITLNTGFSFAGTAILAVNVNSGSATLTTNGKTIDVPFQIGINSLGFTLTLADDLNVVDLYTDADSSLSINGNNIYCSGNFTNNIDANSSINGTSVLHMIGTGTFTGSQGSTQSMNLPVVFNTSGTITMSSIWRTATTSIVYTAGTIVTTGNTLYILGANNPTVNTSTIEWEDVHFDGGSNYTVTITGNFLVNGTLGIAVTSGPANNYTFTGGTIKVRGDFTMEKTSGSVSGTTTFLVEGSGLTISGTFTTGVFRCNLEINTSGSVTLSGTIRYGTGTFTYTDGQVTGDATSNFVIVTVAPTITINGTTLTFGTLTVTVTCAFGGTRGFNIDNFVCSTAGLTITWDSGSEYIINDSITVAGTAESHVAFQSSSTPTQAIITLGTSCSQDVGFCDATDIDSSGGKTVWSYKGGSPIGTFSNTLNWRLLLPERTSSYTFP